MTEKEMEKGLREFDYSVFSKVKDSLLEKILQKYDEDMSEELLSDEELDYAVAAGNANIANRNKDLL